MLLHQRMWLKWCNLARDTRRFYSQNTRWFVTYMLVVPGVMVSILSWIYDVQSRSYMRAATPEEVTEEGFNRWLRKQHREGRFLNEKLK